jgi:hypothetical protein
MFADKIFRSLGPRRESNVIYRFMGLSFSEIIFITSYQIKKEGILVSQEIW